MGALHEGHGELIQQSAKDNDVSLVSIFVNPTQFDNVKDLESYPEDHDRDIELAEQQGAELIFLPSYTELYADDFSYQINESLFSEELCGRPPRAFYWRVNGSDEVAEFSGANTSLFWFKGLPTVRVGKRNV